MDKILNSISGPVAKALGVIAIIEGRQGLV
ncbi:hypothetical protein LCZ91_22485 [Xanthomonas citri pv. mangiferaeindicae]|nr:hypothetical protein [Xanthomonas citri]UDB90674.1 hypothetical protein LCZ91_22485 [Xanthomonas citri pv. mangiferaeindicae]